MTPLRSKKSSGRSPAAGGVAPELRLRAGRSARAPGGAARRAASRPAAAGRRGRSRTGARRRCACRFARGHLQHAGQHAVPHHRALAADRVDAARRTRAAGRPSGASRLRRRQRVGDDLLQARRRRAGRGRCSSKRQRRVAVLLRAAGRRAASPAGGRSRGCGPAPRSGRRRRPGCRGGAAAPSRAARPAPTGSTLNSSARRMRAASAGGNVDAEEAARPRAIVSSIDLRRQRRRVAVDDALADACRRRAGASARRRARRRAHQSPGGCPAEAHARLARQVEAPASCGEC